MKGLLIKDILYMKNQGKLLALVLLIGLLLMASAMNILFINAYITLVMATFVLSTISYDEYENGSAFLFSLPVTRTGYVNEKYVFCFIACAAAWLFSILLVLGYMMVKREYIDFGEIGFSSIMNLLLVLVFLGISMPIRIKFGAEKGKVVYFIILGMGALLFFLYRHFIETVRAEIWNQFKIFFEYNVHVIEWICVVISLLVFGISYLISLNIVKKKEF